MKDIQMFNVRYLDDLYGVKAVVKNGEASCVLTKYRIALKYEHQLKGMMEIKLANDENFRNDFLRGFIVHFNISQEVVSMPSTETRVRIGFKQASSGKVQMDLTVEAPTVDEAGELLAGAIDKLRKKVGAEGLATTDQD